MLTCRHSPGFGPARTSPATACRARRGRTAACSASATASQRPVATVARTAPGIGGSAGAARVSRALAGSRLAGGSASEEGGDP